MQSMSNHVTKSTCFDIFFETPLDWISGPLAMVWKPYSLLSSNCQHYASDLQAFLSDPKSSENLKSDRQIVRVAVAHDGRRLSLVAEELTMDADIVLTAVQQCGQALQYAASQVKSD